MEASRGGTRHQALLQQNLSPADWRPDQASEPDTGGYATRMCSSLWFQVGGLLALCRILLQQQLPRSSKGHDSIWVIVDRITKVAHFIPVRTSYQGDQLADLYMSRIVCLHGVPREIVSNRGTQFTSRFWKQVQEALGTKLTFSTAYHPQTGGQTERVNQILEDMLRACALAYGSKLEDCLPYTDFSYNNSYQSSLQMAQFEALWKEVV